MKESDKDLLNYVDELEAKIVDLSVSLKDKNNQLQTIQSENYHRIRQVIHNLINPIGVASSFAEILASNESIIANEKHKKHLEIIKHSNDYSLQILNSLAKLNRIKAADFKLTNTRVNYTELVLGVIAEFSKEAEKKAQIISTKIPENNVFLNIDATEIAFVIRALIQNALRFSPKSKTITIEINEQEHGVETIITDQGIGISETHITSIFNEFYVVNTYDTNGKKCIGLGLAIAKNILQHYHGNIEVNSTLNLGTVARVLIQKK